MLLKYFYSSLKKISKLFFLVFLLNFFNIQYSYTQSIDEAYILYNEDNYAAALKILVKLIKKDKDNLELNYKTGICYLKTNFNKADAVGYLETALKDPKISKKIHFELGEAYFHALQFDKAEAKYNEYLQILKNEAGTPEEIKEVERFKEMCGNAKELMQHPIDVTFVNLGEGVNNKQDDYNPFITEEESVLIYTSLKKYDPEFQLFVKNVFINDQVKNGLTKSKSAGSKVNSDEDATVVGLSKDGKTILLYVDRYNAYHDIYFSKWNGKRYDLAVDAGKPINGEKSIEMGACLSANNDTIYFSSDRKGGLGGMDIYYSIALPDGTWSEPQNIGIPINTPYDDNYPNISFDGKTMYFASKGFNSMGGYDIFISKYDNNLKKWETPQNIGYPINNTYDNKTISYTGSRRYAYVSEVRSDGYGAMDIYKVIFNTIAANAIAIAGKIAVGDTLNSIPLSVVDNEITISVYKKGETDLYGRYLVNKTNGKYVIALYPGTYDLVIEGTAYITYKKEITIKEEYYNESVISRNIWLKKKTQNTNPRK